VTGKRIRSTRAALRPGHFIAVLTLGTAAVAWIVWVLAPTHHWVSIPAIFSGFMFKVAHNRDARLYPWAYQWEMYSFAMAAGATACDFLRNGVTPPHPLAVLMAALWIFCSWKGARADYILG